MNKRMKCLLVLGLVALAGCSATPTRPSNAPSIVYNKGEAAVQQAAVDALVANGFEIDGSGSDYVGGSRPHKMGLLVGSGGESAGVWLSPLDRGKTAVSVSTAKSLLGIVGQKNWDAEIIAEMDRRLGSHGYGDHGSTGTRVVPDGSAAATSEPVPAGGAASSSESHSASASSPAPIADAAIASNAQSVATQMGCGAIQSQGDSTFVAPCSTYDVLIGCYDDQCRPMHTVNVKSNE